jgi:hypothetical protein
MPAIAAFLKGTVSESLTKLVQPAGLVPATFFVLLNLAFIYPTAQEDKVGIAQTFHDLAGVWQTITAASVIFALGYILLNSANVITETLSGENWRNSVLGTVLITWQRARRYDLDRRADNAGPNEHRTELKWRLATHYPPRSTGSQYLAPTRFGNVLEATQATLLERYKIDLTALWSPLEAAKDLKGTPALEAVKDERSTLELLANTIFILGLFTFECIAFFGVRRRWHDALVSLLLLPIAYVVYRVAIRAARTWGDSVLAAFDLHRDDLRKALGLRDSIGLEDERELWEDASDFYLPGVEDVDESNLFDASGPLLSAIAPAALTVTTVVNRVVDVVDKKSDHIVLRALEYTFLVARVGEPGLYSDADVVVSDTRLGVIRDEDVPDTVRHRLATATPRRQGKATLVWEFSRLEKGAAMTLDYRLPLWTLAVEGGALPTVSLDPGIGFALEWQQDLQSATIVLTSAAATMNPLARPKLAGVDAEFNADEDEPGVYRAEGVAIAAGATLTLTLP